MSDKAQSAAEHLKLVQGVVSRMAGNSAQMKTWTVSLVAACIVFSGLSNDPHWLIGVAGWVPVFAFWAMDARYLHLERCYIRLYAAIVDGRPVAPFELDYRPYASEVDSPLKIALSWSVGLFYGSLFLVLLLLVAFLAFRN